MQIPSFFRVRLLAGLAAGIAALFFAGPLPAKGGGEDGIHHGGDDGGGTQTESEFVGRVEVLPASGLLGVWQVNGVSFAVDASTSVDQERSAIAVGSLVEVKTTRNTDGSLLAVRIHAEDAGRREEFGETELVGIINALPATTGFIGAWTVDNRVVLVSAATVILTERGAAAVGVKAEVKGNVLSDGSVQAVSIKTEDAGFEAEDHHFFGRIESLPTSGLTGEWQVSGLRVLVSESTKIETEHSAPQLGVMVKIEGIQQPDASIVANEIEIQGVASAAGDDAVLIGHIERLPDTDGHFGNWSIDGVVVTVTPNSVFDNRGRKARSGREVEIHGKLQVNGSVVVDDVFIPRKTEVTGKQFLRFTGTVSSNQPATDTQPGALIVEGKTVSVSLTTRIIGSPVIGSSVTVKAVPGAGGLYEALRIKVNP